MAKPPVPTKSAAAARTQRDLTQGNIPRHLVRLAIPGALINLMSYSTMFVDMIWLGRVSPQAIAAVTTFNYFWFLFALLNQTIGNGSVTLIARTFGAGDIEECRRVFGQTFMFKLIVAVLAAIIGLSGLRLALRLFGAPPDVFSLAVEYGTLMLLFTPLMFSTFTLKTGMRAIGDMKTLVAISLATMVINLLLDPLLIFQNIHIGPWPALGLSKELLLPAAGLGVKGAAWGTIIAFGLTFVMALFVYLTGRTYIKVQLWHLFHINWPIARRIIRIGFPPASGDSLQHIANLFVGAAINTYGTVVFAAQGVNQMLIRLIRMMIFGLNMALITMVGQNLGADNPRRSERSVLVGMLAVVGILLIISILFFFSAPLIARLFVPGNDPESVATAEWVVKILRINCFVFLPFGLMRVFRAPFDGSGDTKPSLWATLIATFGVQLPLTLGGVYLLEVAEPFFIWWVEGSAYLAGAVFLYFMFIRGRWKSIRV